MPPHPAPHRPLRDSLLLLGHHWRALLLTLAVVSGTSLAVDLAAPLLGLGLIPTLAVLKTLRFLLPMGWLLWAWRRLSGPAEEPTPAWEPSITIPLLATALASMLWGFASRLIFEIQMAHGNPMDPGMGTYALSYALSIGGYCLVPCVAAAACGGDVKRAAGRLPGLLRRTVVVLALLLLVPDYPLRLVLSGLDGLLPPRASVTVYMAIATAFSAAEHIFALVYTLHVRAASGR